MQPVNCGFIVLFCFLHVIVIVVSLNESDLIGSPSSASNTQCFVALHSWNELVDSFSASFNLSFCQIV